ncbi:MazG family protein [Nocardioides limicola]|uniref:MazG family protein n=1 Tax=Nocardioides limicola TaxID=2803368 RepID=UPI0027DB8293|nr:MazG family protein [Nocardioides sp. DJM-14]
MTRAGEGERLLEFLAMMRELRAGCDWKQAQTHRSLARFLLEETHETLEAIDSGDLEHLCEELGDLLLQIWFHAVIAEESGAFDLEDVASGVLAKMRRRNPHVFGEAQASGVDSIEALWQQMKAAEKPRTSVTDGLPPGLPALLYADKLLGRLEGHPVEPGSVVEPVETPSDSDAIGEALLALVAQARRSGVDPEQALRDAVRRRLP